MKTTLRTTMIAFLLGACAVAPPEAEVERAASSPLAFTLADGALRARMDRIGLTASVREGVVHVATATASLSLETTSGDARRRR